MSVKKIQRRGSVRISIPMCIHDTCTREISMYINIYLYNMYIHIFSAYIYHVQVSSTVDDDENIL
jgi:hypothetical protein